MARPSARPAVRRGANRPGPAAQADPAPRYALIKWALLAALIVYGGLVVGANSARYVDFGVIARSMADDEDVGDLLALDENAVLTDASELDAPAVTVEGAQAIKEWMKEQAEEESGFFIQLNTEIRTENGKIVEINRHYIP